MILTSLTLNNFCQYKNLTYEYQPGITGVTGRNGQGKTNLLDIAQYFAITGKTPEGYKKKSLVNWDATTGKTVLEFSHVGKRYRLTRAVHAATVKLEFLDQDEEPVTGKEVNEYMQQFLGMSPELFHATCFVSQGNLWNVITMSHAERMKYLQRLTEVDQAERLRGIIQTVGINELPAFVDRSEEIKQCQQQVVSLRSELSALNKRKAELEKLQQKYEPRVNEARKILDAPTTEEVEARAAEIKTALDQVLKERDQFLKENTLEERTPVADVTDEERKAAEDFKTLQQANKDWSQNSTKLNEVKQQLEELGDPAELRQKASALADELQPMATRLESLRSQLELAKEGKCPKCGKPYDDPMSVDDIKTEGKKLKAELQEKQAQWKKLDEEASEAAAAQSKLQYQQETLEKACRELAETVERCQYASDWDMEAFEAAQAKYKEYLQYQQRVAKYQEALREKDIAVTRKEAEYEQAKAVAGVPKTQKKAAREILDNFEQLQSDITANGNKIVAAETSLKAQRERLAEYESEAETRKHVDALRGELEKCRELYHRENIPKIVMQYLITRLNKYMMKYVQLFELDFVAEINEDFDFVAHFPTKSNFPAVQLSGGQKVALSIAYHLALTEVFAGGIPLMMLDEPTNHLDEANRQQIRVVLDRIRGVADKGTVFQVATHDPILYPAFDRQIELGDLLTG